MAATCSKHDDWIVKAHTEQAERYQAMADELAKNLRLIIDGWKLDEEISAEPTIMKRDLVASTAALAKYDAMKGEE